MKKDLISIKDLTRDDYNYLIDTAITIKKDLTSYMMYCGGGLLF